MAVPAVVKPPIPNEFLGSSERQMIVTATMLSAGSVDLSLYGGGPCRSVVLLGSGTFAYEPSSPMDDTSPLITIPVSLPAFTSLDIAVRKIDSTTTAAPILVLF